MFGYVRRAARKLDEIRPGWHNEISLDRLDLASYEECVLGQLYGRYDPMRDDHLAEPFGVLTAFAFAPWFSRLTAWRVEIAERRAADVGRELRELEADSPVRCPDLVVHKTPNPGQRVRAGSAG